MNQPESLTRKPPVMLRSFGRRHGRVLREWEVDLFRDVLPKVQLTLPPQEATIDLGTLLPNAQQWWLEIGFGSGEHLSAQAALHPDIGFIGCEPFDKGVAKLLRDVRAVPLSNVSVFMDDARLLLDRLPDAVLDRVFILFPDPWPKQRHHKRRLVQRALLVKLARTLRQGGELRMVSDHPDYVAWMLEVMQHEPCFSWTANQPEDFLQEPTDWVPTRYQQKTMQQGRQPTFLLYRRNALPAA
ncbi:MAG: tRNA (guanosine(46)-N7)-methyltransferase TrmB [Rickettsiales bacterium]|nr:tRNA (guanosine(46)-N7)-methyltransferase TrmB [Rickettsiales bacterium]